MTKVNRDALIEAVKAGDDDRVRLLVSGDEELVDTRVDDVSLVMLAIYYGHRDIAQTLIDYGATVDIFVASALNKADRLAMLLQGDRNEVNSWSADGWTPLALAAYFGSDAAARLLISCGADFQAQSKNATGNMPLHAAVAGKRAELVELLVEQGADINARDTRGWTPLNLAAHEGPISVVEYLLAHGADPSIPNDEGRTPLQTAEHEGRQAVVEVLRG